MSKLRFALLSALATIATSAAVLAAAPAQAAGAQYVALGDSYSSGVGTRSYISDSGNCYRSTQAYPYQVAADKGYQLGFVACSGAEVSDVRANQLSALGTDTRYVTISIGGNDAGFADVITECSIPFNNCTSDIEAANTYIRNTLPGSLNSLYGEIKSKAPNAKVVVVGYPRLFSSSGCSDAFNINTTERQQLNATADLLSSTISARAGAAGFTYANAITPFTGHAVCASADWVNGLSSPTMESYHPNQDGQDGYTALVKPLL